MRRLVVIGVACVLIVGSAAAAGWADPSGKPAQDPTARAARTEQLARLSEPTPLGAVPIISCDPHKSAERYINCLHKYLNRMARNLNQTIKSLQRTQADLYNLYDCILAAPVTQYMGYLYGDVNAPFNTTGLDFTEDPTTETFDYFALVDPACVAP